MGKSRSNEIIIVSSENESENDSLELINPILNLSLEHFQKKNLIKDLNKQIQKFSRLHLNDKNLFKKSKLPQHHRASFKKKNEIENKSGKEDYSMKYLKTLPYVEFSAEKKIQLNEIENLRSLYIQINSSIKQIFSKSFPKKTYHCNRRFL
ncbi:hypothetical protein I4U23_027640 [Adineta vaga]|nr:hypothetical protein I4U23_027640 [Adineta vaga]